MKLHQQLARLQTRLGQPVDGSGLAIFRIAFGLLLAYELALKLQFEKHLELVAKNVHFAFPFFGWLPRPNNEWQSVLFHLVLIGLSLFVAAGCLFRVSCVLLWLSLSAYFLMEQSLYLNHMYLYCLLCGLLSFSAAHNMLSVDAWLALRLTGPTSHGVAPLYNIAALRFQAAVVYVFAGIAKLNPEWIQGIPLNLWLPHRVNSSVWGEALSRPELPRVMAIGGLLFDLAIVPLLLTKQTRVVGFFIACGFHIINATVFGLASFPWMSIALLTLFFEPDWPRRVLGTLRRLFPALGRLERFTSTQVSGMLQPGLPTWGAVLLALYCTAQLLIPLRHVLYPGAVSWTEEGHRFSWRMMLRTKQGHTEWTLRFPTSQEERRIDPSQDLTRRQLRKLNTTPDMLLQYAHFLADREERLGRPRPQVYVDAKVSLNGRPSARLVSRDQDLAALSRGLGHATWILPAE